MKNYEYPELTVGDIALYFCRLSYEQMDCIKDEIDRAYIQSKKAFIAKRNRWIDEQRRKFKQGQQKNCIVCGKHCSIAHAHHIVSLAEQYYGGERGNSDNRYVWLCPTHHSAVHRLATDVAKYAREFEEDFIALYSIVLAGYKDNVRNSLLIHFDEEHREVFRTTIKKLEEFYETGN